MTAMASRREFGSFHSSNTLELITIPEEEYIAPSIPFGLPSFQEYKTEPFQFGKAAREKHFHLEDCTFINHGAFGATLKQALDVAQKWQLYIEKQPLRFMDRELIPHLVYVTKRLAQFVGCAARDVVLLPNVTTGINCVLRSQDLSEGDTIFCLSVTYGAVKKTLAQVCAETGASVQEELLNLPLTGKQQIIDLVSSTLKPGTKLAVFDHIPSNTPFIMPLKELIDLCHQREVPVLVDGAHALGALPLDIGALGPDYYVANCHKWFSSVKGCALMYVSRELQAATRPLVISHGFGSGFNSEFVWSGLRDYSPYLSLHTVLDLWQTAGPDRLRQHMHALSRKAAELLVEKWNTSLIAPQDMFGCMRLVQLPIALYEKCKGVSYSTAEKVQNILYHRFNIEVPIKEVNGQLYVRISTHVYNELDEYAYLARSILKLVEEDVLKD